jgi:hypothetical protein
MKIVEKTRGWERRLAEEINSELKFQWEFFDFLCKGIKNIEKTQLRARLKDAQAEGMDRGDVLKIYIIRKLSDCVFRVILRTDFGNDRRKSKWNYEYSEAGRVFLELDAGARIALAKSVGVVAFKDYMYRIRVAHSSELSFRFKVLENGDIRIFRGSDRNLEMIKK